MAEQQDDSFRAHLRGQPLDAADPRTLGGFRLLESTEEAEGTQGTGSAGEGREDGLRRYLARSPRDARTVSLTAVRPGMAGDPALRERLRREAEATAAAAGPWVVPLIDADPDAAVPWLAYAYVPTLPLTGLVRDHGPLPEAAVRALGTALADALGTLHEAGWAHGGLGPEAVALAADGPRLGGLGTARPATPETTEADVHALGAVLAHAATGRDGTALEGAPAALPPPLDEALRSALGEGTTGGRFARGARGTRGTRKGQSRLSKLRSALRAPLAADGPVVPLPAGVVATLAARASEVLALESPDGVPAGEDRSTRMLRVPGPRTDGAAPAGDHPTLTLQARPGTQPQEQADERAEPDQDTEAEAVPASEGDGTGTLPIVSRSGSGSGPAAFGPARSRRSLLRSGAAGAAGVLVGAGALAGWVTGRGGGLDALTSPGSSPSGTSGASARKPPRGTAPRALWRYDLPGGISVKNEPLVWRDEIAIMIGTDGSVGIDMSTGKTVWSRNDLSSVHASRFISSELAVVVDKGKLVAFSARTGQRRWDTDVYRAGTADYSGRSADELLHATADGRVAFLTALNVAADDDDARKVLTAYDLRERRERWYVPFPDAPLGSSTSLRETGSSLVLVRSAEDHPRLASYRLSDGRRRWQRTLEDLEADAPLALSPSAATLYAAQSDELRALTAESGKKSWARPLVSDGESRLGPIAHRPAPPSGKKGKGGADGRKRQSRLYVADSGRTVFAVDPDDGREVWRRAVDADSVWGDQPVLETSASGRTLLAASSSGVVAMDARTGSLLWRFRQTEGDSLQKYRVYPAGDRILVTHSASAFAFPVD
ncbi:PQQ-binding-like beta-propeller repeat protein [Streptomyces sp. N2-109]|uniref:PQQ-binding-like beta-propeller repeat protein n=1 Tax=Streptomyces gossypii TaxID=2883101 RepID=A0ABT2JV66_9ACTN|nr:PQQ-binding-like beta-propeller repeat protein [Streptomyces gossypii]MCT2591792.1 PQQ-binding-like beta-propeller repeat protein [Streptomyces gossypii]